MQIYMHVSNTYARCAYIIYVDDTSTRYIVPSTDRHMYIEALYIVHCTDQIVTMLTDHMYILMSSARS